MRVGNQCGDNQQWKSGRDLTKHTNRLLSKKSTPHAGYALSGLCRQTSSRIPTRRRLSAVAALSVLAIRGNARDAEQLQEHRRVVTGDKRSRTKCHDLESGYVN